jgi:hypothetical protein
LKEARTCEHDGAEAEPDVDSDAELNLPTSASVRRTFSSAIAASVGVGGARRNMSRSSEGSNAV